MVIIIDGTNSKSIKINVYKDDKLFLKKIKTNINIYEYLDKFFRKADFSKIMCIGINIGPGSFSSTRASVAYIVGLSFGSKIPVIGVSGFDILSRDKKPLILNAGRGRVYIKSEDKFLIKESSVYEEIDDNVFFSIIKERLQKKQFDSPLTLLPLYMDDL